jgi:molybdopterin-guanine dinucleotide biosynthesis protein A
MGRDKARLSWAGEPLASRVAARVRAACGQAVLVGGGAGRSYEDLGWPWWPDPPELAGAGPLAGLLTALTIAERILLVACDLPAIEPELLRRIVALARGRPAGIPVIGGRLQPLCAVYGSEVAAQARASIAVGSRRMSDLYSVPGVLRLPEGALGTPGQVAHQFDNLNDLSALDRYPELRLTSP